MSNSIERDRISRTYARYAESARKQRSWSAENPGNIAIRSELVDATFARAGGDLCSAREILDVGCGSGWWLERLSADDRISARLHGIDLIPERRLAASRCVPDVAVINGDARELPYEDGRFDVVTLFTVLSSLSGSDDVMRALREAQRVLAPAGVLLIWEPRLPNPLNRSTLLLTPALVRRALPGMPVEAGTTTVLPMLARRLGAWTERLYPALARVPMLRTHRLLCARAQRP